MKKATSEQDKILLKARPKTQRAVALILTLSILALMTTALMKSFDYRATEMRFVNASRRDFEIEVFARSSFRALAAGLKTAGPWGLFESTRGLYAYKDPKDPHFYPLALPVGGGVIGNLRVRLLDHAFNLNPNRPFEDKSREYYSLQNLIANLHKEDPNFVAPEVEPFLSQLNDFIDDDDETDSRFIVGGEQYFNLTPSFMVKNRGLYHLDEIKILPAYPDLQLNQSQLKNNFRVYIRTMDSAIDVNMASKQEIIDFLARYKDIEDYPNVSSRSEEIATVILQDRSTASPKYYVSTGNLRGRSSPLIEDLKVAAIKLDPLEKDLFKSETELVEIEYLISMGGRTKRVSAIVGFNWTWSPLDVPSAKMTLHQFNVI
ncbi:MAG: hypothetical protein QNL04_11920 [SAR324 cluster bacterium]|nr:hypothetical protein [SAR324 cluster bacterium]